MSEWPIEKILVAVDDSPAALAAARTAVELAVHTGGQLLFVHVCGDGELLRALTVVQRDNRVAERRTRGAESLLRHLVRQADRRGIQAGSASLDGEPATIILGQARSWQADLIVIGRSDVRAAGRPYVGTVTRHVLEFSDGPVLVVPRPD